MWSLDLARSAREVEAAATAANTTNMVRAELHVACWASIIRKAVVRKPWLHLARGIFARVEELDQAAYDSGLIVGEVDSVCGCVL